MPSALPDAHYAEFLRQREARIDGLRKGRPAFAVHDGGAAIPVLPVMSYEDTVSLAREAAAAVMQGTPEEQARIRALLDEISGGRP